MRKKKQHYKRRKTHKSNWWLDVGQGWTVEQFQWSVNGKKTSCRCYLLAQALPFRWLIRMHNLFVYP